MSRNPEKATLVVAFFVFGNPSHYKHIFPHTLDNLTTIVVNFRTPDLLRAAIETFVAAYPSAQIVIVENGSDSETVAAVKNLESQHRVNIRVMYLSENIFHGPAMHRAITFVNTPYVFLLDSDTVTQQAGFLEEMLMRFENENVYAVGKTVNVNKRGFASRSGKITVAASAYLMLDRFKYQKLPPFIHHGLPVLNNFQAAANRGWSVENYPVDEYIDHLGRGTAKKFGYSLGLKGKIDYLLNKLGL